MTLVGCDLHARRQQLAVLDTATGEVREEQLSHDGDAVERFYAALPPPVTVAVESTGYALWFHAVIRRLGHTLLVGDASKIRAMVVRKTKNDRRDALHLLDLLRHERLPLIWVPDPETRDLRTLLAHRMRLVRFRTAVMNGLHAMALSHRLVTGSKRLTRSRVAQLSRLALPPHTARRRDESLELMSWLADRIRQLDVLVERAVEVEPAASRLLTHPGVGPVTALTTVVVLGPVSRFPGSKEVTSYVGLAPALHASADTHHLGQITKQGNPLLRLVLVQAASIAARYDEDLKHLYTVLSRRRGHAKAKVAIARKLLVRLFIMLRDGIDYEEFRRRGRSHRLGEMHSAPAT
jgi:transposase